MTPVQEGSQGKFPQPVHLLQRLEPRTPTHSLLASSLYEDASVRAA